MPPGASKRIIVACITAMSLGAPGSSSAKTSAVATEIVRPARAVGDGRDRPRVRKAVLLGDVRRGRQADAHLPVLDAGDGGPQGPHQGLPVERLADAVVKVGRCHGGVYLASPGRSAPHSGHVLPGVRPARS